MNQPEEQKIVSEFERLWSDSQSPPDVFAFMEKYPELAMDSRQKIVLSDQYRRWKSGQGLQVEQYFDRCPDLLDDEKFMVELIAEEFGYLEETSHPPDVHEFLKRFDGLSKSSKETLANAIGQEMTIQSIHDQLAPSPSVTVETPSQIDRFSISKTLGRGSFGVVYLGRDDELERNVAIKVPHRSHIDDLGGVDAFLREARVIASLDHPSIVPVYDVGKLPDGQCYLVTKYIDGTDLRSSIREGFTFVKTAGLVSTVAGALHYAHGQGLVHRDIKPANILMDESLRPFVVDFGLALKEEDYGQGAKLVGTPAYMSPEQASGAGNLLDGRSDIYSLGVVLYELLTGRRPYRAVSATELMEQIQTAEVKPPRQINDQIPRELEEICLRALSKKITERYRTAKDLAEDLDSFCATQTAQSSESLVGTRRFDSTESDFSQTARSFSATDSVDQKTAFPRWLLAAVLVGCVAAIGIGIYNLIAFGKQTDSDGPVEPETVVAVDATEVPVSAERIMEIQLECAKNLELDLELKLADRMVMRLIPSGRFRMGSSRDEIDLLPLDDWFFKKWQKERMYCESPTHNVEISKPFYMSAHEVTIAQFRRFIRATGYETTAEQDEKGGYGWQDGLWLQKPEFNWQNIGFEQADDHPVNNVSWDDAVAYCKWLSEEENATFRLPTEAEWEYACRAGTHTWFSSGDRDETLKQIANIADHSLSKKTKFVEWGRPWDDGFAFTSPVGNFQPNAFGLFDMHGNAWEWCSDWYGSDYYRDSSEVDPKGPDVEKLKAAELIEAKAKKRRPRRQYHVFRGGGWDNYPGFVRSADRYSSHSPDIRSRWAGIRLVREVE